MVGGYSLLRSRLDSEHKRITEELKQLLASAPTGDDRREGSPFGKREEEATESFELEKRLALEKQIRDRLAEVEHALSLLEQPRHVQLEQRDHLLFYPDKEPGMSIIIDFLESV